MNIRNDSILTPKTVNEVIKIFFIPLDELE